MARQWVMMTVLLAVACSGDEGATDTAVDPWADYETEAPTGAVLEALGSTPFLWPEQVCVDAAGLDLPEGTQLSVAEDGTEQLCVWDAFSGNVPEGMVYTDVLSCDRPYTQGPSWWAPPERVYESDLALLDDPTYAEESKWVSDQILSSGCACCHASGSASPHVTGFDVNAPGVWTDSMTNAQLAMAAGRFPEHSLFGHFPAQDNHGFDRTETLFASTDPDRMKAFFEAELDRRELSQADLDVAQGQFDALFGRLFDPVNDCVEPYEGLIDGSILWNSEDGARQVYVLEADAATPGFPPNLHLPEGTVWALFVDPDKGEPIAPGTLAIGQVPENTFQAFPEDGAAPDLEPGKTYRLFASADVMSTERLSCTFTYAGE